VTPGRDDVDVVVIGSVVGGPDTLLSA